MAIENPEKNPLNQNLENKKIDPSVINLKQTEKPVENLPKDWLITNASTGNNDEEKITETIFKLGKFGKIVFWFLVGAVIILIGVGGFYYYQYSQGSSLNLSLKAPDNVMVGVPFEIQADFSNNSGKTIQDVKIEATLPEGIFLGDDKEKRYFEQDFGDLTANTSIEAKIPVTIFADPDSIKKFTVSASYLPSSLGPKSRFDKASTLDIAVKEPAIKLDLTTPEKILSNENFQIKLDYKNVSDYKFPNAQIELTYPNSFRFISANPTTTLGNNIWAIDELDKGAGGTITIQGSVIAADQSFFQIKTAAKVPLGTITEKTASINITESPLSLNVALNNSSNYIARLDDSLHYVLNYKNSSEVGLNDVVITAKLNGTMFNFLTVNGNGFFTSQNNTITWNAANTPELKMIAPGASRSVDFDIKTNQTYPIKRLADKNFVLKVDGEISSPTVPYYVSADKTIAITHFETKVSGRAQLGTLLLYRDSTSGIKNTGPIPLKVNSPTSLTVHWLITNYSDDLQNIQVKSTVLAGVKIGSKITSNTSAVPVFDERTGEITWSIPAIPANKGVIGQPTEAIFQIIATPSVNQAGQPMPLLGDTTLTATDAFTSSTLTDAQSPMTTSQLSNDPTVSQGQGTVAP